MATIKLSLTKNNGCATLVQNHLCWSLFLPFCNCRKVRQFCNE